MKILGYKIKDGCGDSSCHVKISHGMMTNGGCRCLPIELNSAVRILIQRELQRLGYPKEVVESDS